MKKTRKLILSVFLCMAVVAANLLSIGFPVMRAHAATVYTVTLSPGDGMGDPIIYRSDEKPIAKDWRSAGDCDFYYENSGIGFRLPDDYCPDSFTAPEGYTFDKWEGNGVYNILTSVETSFTADWRFAGEAKITVSPSEFTLTSDSFDAEGYAPVSIEITELDFGPDADYGGGEVSFIFNEETLIIPGSSDKMICQPYTVEHDEGGEWLSTESFFEPGEYRFVLYIDPEVLAAATPGTYEGEMMCDFCWMRIGKSDAPDFVTIPISLTVTGDDSALPPSDEPEGVLIHRMYNPNSGEHFYTESDEERDILISLGWINEDGCSFTAPEASDDTLPVYRLYNPNGYEHLFTIDKGEVETLEEYGWISEGIRFHAYDTDSEQGVHLYRAYNPNDGHHFFTTDKAEQDYVVSLGFRDEGIGWNVMS